MIMIKKLPISNSKKNKKDKNEEVKMLLMKALAIEKIYVRSNDNHFHIIAVGEMFASMSNVSKQKAVYAPLMKMIRESIIHAVSIETYTPQEWIDHQKNTY